MTKIAINGMGRIGKMVLKSLIEHGFDGEVALLNDPIGTPEQHATWLEFDTIHGRWPAEFAHDTNGLTINGHRMRMSHASKPSDVPLREAKIDVVIDCSGIFNTPTKLQSFFEAGVKKVIAATPIRQTPAVSLVLGVNHETYDPELHHLISATSSTTNCFAPIVKIIHEEFEIIHGSFTVIHGATNTQNIADRPGKDVRRARSAMNSLIPAASSAASAISLIFPELEESLNGHAIRVPVMNGSLIDCTFEVTHETNVDEVNALFREYAGGLMRGIMGYEERSLVSADFLNDPRSCIIDAPSTMVINETQVKVVGWFDNEWGYACRLADLTRLISSSMT